MAQTVYSIRVPPAEYDPLFLYEVLRELHGRLDSLQVPFVILAQQNAAPERLIEGMVANADGTNWNPGSGGGLYEYVGGAWNKL